MSAPYFPFPWQSGHEYTFPRQTADAAPSAADTEETVTYCEYCEENAAEEWVRSEDPSTGYREEMHVCGECKRRLGRRD